MTSKGLRLLGYGRVSDVRGRSGESFISPEEQKSKWRGYAATYDHTIIDEGFDFDISGGVMERPVLSTFLARIKNGEAQGLIVAKLDRFSRSSRGALNALEEIEAAGGVLISVQEQIDSTTAAGRFVRAIFLATAEWERERIGENWTAAQKSAVARGVHISRHVPPGYQRNGDGRLKPHPKHGQTISQAFELAAKGTPYARIADYFNECGLPSGDLKTTTHWQPNRIKRLLANRVYLGEARYGTITNPEAHKPLTDLTTFLLAQRLKTASVKPDSSYLLSGLVRCASCSYSMRPQGQSKTGAATYRCATDTASGRCPHPSTITMRKLEDYVFELYVERMFNKPDSEPTPERDDTELRAKLEDAKEKLNEVLADEEKLRTYGVFEQARDAALGQIEATSRALASPQLASVEQSAQEAMPLLHENIGRLEAGESPLETMSEDGKQLLRVSLAAEIQAVFIRPAASRSHSLPISDRVRIVWNDDEPLELPRRGERFEPRAYVW